MELLKDLSEKAMLTNLTTDQKLTIKNARVVVINTKDNNSTNYPESNKLEKVCRLKPQAECRNIVIDLFKLNEEQKRAFLIITEHLDDEGFLIKGNLFIKIKFNCC